MQSATGVQRRRSPPSSDEMHEDSFSDPSSAAEDADTDLSSVSTDPHGPPAPKPGGEVAAKSSGSGLLHSAWSTFATLRDMMMNMAQSAVVRALSVGPMPEHIAFIMDGNRRWSREHGSHVQHGHQMGFQALKRVLELCMSLERVHTVTVYAFAIDNFKRDPSEVAALMDLARSRLLELIGHGEVVSRHSIRIRVVGHRSLLPRDVQAAVERIEEATKYNTRGVLNICMPYSARDEMSQAANACVREGTALTQEAFEKHLMVTDDVPVDLLVRTSRVSRLSDFLLWQCNESTQLHFVDRYWPQFGLWDFAPILLAYQRDRITGMLAGESA